MRIVKLTPCCSLPLVTPSSLQAHTRSASDLRAYTYLYHPVHCQSRHLALSALPYLFSAVIATIRGTGLQGQHQLRGLTSTIAVTAPTNGSRRDPSHLRQRRLYLHLRATLDSRFEIPECHPTGRDRNAAAVSGRQESPDQASGHDPDGFDSPTQDWTTFSDPTGGAIRPSSGPPYIHHGLPTLHNASVLVFPMAYHMEEPDYKLEVRQQPVYARVAIGKEKGTCTRQFPPD